MLGFLQKGKVIDFRNGLGVDGDRRGRAQVGCGKMGWGREFRIDSWNWGTFGVCMVILYSRNFLESMKMILMRMESQLTISCSQVRILVEGLSCIQSGFGQRGPMEIPEQARLMQKQRLTFHKWPAGAFLC